MQSAPLSSNEAYFRTSKQGGKSATQQLARFCDAITYELIAYPPRLSGMGAL